MRQPLSSHLPQIGSAATLPNEVTPPFSGSVDAATLELLASWQEQDATLGSEQLQAAEQEVRKFMKAVNDARVYSGEPLLYP